MSTSEFDSSPPSSSADSDDRRKSKSAVFAADPQYAHLPSSDAFLPPLDEWDYKDPVSDIELHPKIIDMLSQSSNLFEDLWPTIIELATPQQRLASFAEVNRFFARLCAPTKKSDEAKWVSNSNRSIATWMAMCFSLLEADKIQ